MNTSTIRTTINDALAAQGVRANQYSNYVEPVASALEAQVAQVVDNAKRVMAQKGLSEGEAEGILITIGLVPAPESAAASGGSNESELAGTVARLVEFARRHGFRA